MALNEQSDEGINSVPKDEPIYETIDAIGSTVLVPKDAADSEPIELEQDEV